MFVFFTEILQRDVVDKHGRWVAWPHDFTVQLEGAYPPVVGLVLRRGRVSKEYAVVPWKQVHTTNYKSGAAIQLRVTLESLEWSKREPTLAEPTLKYDVLDQQVVDIYNRKVVRVNDVHLLHVDSHFRIAHVDVGTRGIVRRLGWESVVDRFMRALYPHARYLTREGFIGWKYVQPLTINPSKGTIPLAVSEEELHAIPPADLSEILVELDPYQRTALFKSLDALTQGEILGELEERFQKELISELDTKTAVTVLERMPSDEATDILQEVPRRDVERYLAAMSARKSKKLQELLRHEEDSAGGMMTTEVIRIPNTCTVGDAIQIIKDNTGVAETIYYAYVIDADQRLQGVVDFRGLIVESSDERITEVMNTRPITVHLDDSAKEVAFTLEKYNFFAIPVVDDETTLQGIITADDILTYVIEECWGGEKSGMM